MTIPDPIENFEIHRDVVESMETYIPGKPPGVPTTALAFEKAKAKNLEVVYPGPRELQIDIDRPEDYAVWQAHREIFDQHFKILKVVETPSEEKGHLHLTVTIGRCLNPFERIALQAVLGSDRKRELLGLVMYMIGREHKPTLFLEKKDATG